MYTWLKMPAVFHATSDAYMTTLARSNATAGRTLNHRRLWCKMKSPNRARNNTPIRPNTIPALLRKSNSDVKNLSVLFEILPSSIIDCADDPESSEDTFCSSAPLETDEGALAA